MSFSNTSGHADVSFVLIGFGFLLQMTSISSELRNGNPGRLILVFHWLACVRCTWAGGEKWRLCWSKLKGSDGLLLYMHTKKNKRAPLTVKSILLMSSFLWQQSLYWQSSIRGLPPGSKVRPQQSIEGLFSLLYLNLKQPSRLVHQAVIVQVLFCFFIVDTQSLPLAERGHSLTARSGAAERILQADVNHAERTLCKKKQLQELCRPFTSRLMKVHWT